MKAILLLLGAITIIVVGVGCAALSEYLTPATLDRQAIEYAAEAGVIDVNDFRGYANLEKAIRLELAVKAAYEVKSLALQQMVERNQLDYSLLHDAVLRNTAQAKEQEKQLFGETGILSMGLSLLGVGGLTGALGWMRKRLSDGNRQFVEIVTDGNRQFVEIVKGVQTFIDNSQLAPAVSDLLKEQWEASHRTGRQRRTGVSR